MSPFKHKLTIFRVYNKHSFISKTTLFYILRLKLPQHLLANLSKYALTVSTIINKRAATVRTTFTKVGPYKYWHHLKFQLYLGYFVVDMKLSVTIKLCVSLDQLLTMRQAGWYERWCMKSIRIGIRILPRRQANENFQSLNKKTFARLDGIIWYVYISLHVHLHCVHVIVYNSKKFLEQTRLVKKFTIEKFLREVLCICIMSIENAYMWITLQTCGSMGQDRWFTVRDCWCAHHRSAGASHRVQLQLLLPSWDRPGRDAIAEL